MADKQLARSGTVEFDVLSEDDPLAELARIVGYDNRPAVQQLQELERHRESVRVEPVLDLEDELLREFDAYDAPQAAAIDAPEPVSAEDHIAFAPLPEESDVVPAAVVEPEFVAYEVEELLPEASVEVAAPTVEIAPLAAEEPALAEPEAAVASVGEEPVVDWSPEPVSPEAENVWSLDQYSEPVFDGADLERELELSIGYDAYPVEAPQVEMVFAQTQRVASEEDTLVDARAEEPAEQDIAPSPAFEEPVAAAPVEDFPFGADQSAEAAVESAAQTQGDLPEWQPKPASALKPGEATSAADAHDIDVLLTDIERFPVPAKAAVKLATSADAARKINYPFTPTFSRATPVASNGGVLSQKAFATPLPAATVAAAATVTETAYHPAETPVEPVVTEAAPALKAPVDQEPDFDLDTFELDLSGIDLDIDPSEFETAAPETAFAPAAAIAEEPVSIAAAPAAPVDEIPQDEEPENVLPFDPAMIAETEESLTAIADLNVPQLPAVEQERPVVHQPDYDLDIDAEMAQLFGTPSRSGAGASRGADDELGFGSVPHSIAQTQSVTAGAPAEDDFDEFEKAMEEDFRLSLSKRQEADPSSDRLAVGSGYAANSDFDEEGSGAGKRRLILLAAAVTGLAIFGAVGVYAFMGGNGSVLSGGEPKIILADKSPVKIVPVEKGGKTVPNQDKAVYDRVAGAQDGAPEQGTLVSSTEEPVDVVQRTLTPENLPLEGADEELPGAAPADDDGSERLLPDGQTAENTAAEEDSSPAVSPRKVRTMIVKPDGTLVAREDPVVQPETKVAANETPANQGDPQIKTVKTTAVTPQVETGSTPKSLPAADQAAADQAAAPEQKSALAEAADTTVEETAPVRSVKTTAVADTNPIPQTRPVEEQAKVEEKTKVVDTFKTEPTQQAQPAAEAKPVETASVAPGTYVIQIASLPSEAEAQRSYKTLSGKFGSVIGGKGVDIKKAEIAGKGTYFRVRIPAGSKQEANALCARYKSAGGSCLVTK
ncbi:SPOR domain-containing protein [Pararhizobium sp. LjRoot235]|uniref:SPOR domain-containing protein n=1 Tax=Pararhizobium sp. LjRoot235 TaxID=3342291 RepID=UPI003ED07202